MDKAGPQGQVPTNTAWSQVFVLEKPLPRRGEGDERKIRPPPRFPPESCVARQPTRATRAPCPPQLRVASPLPRREGADAGTWEIKKEFG